MADSKYGRLFTEADVIRLVRVARYTVARHPDEDMTEWPREMLRFYDGDLPADEPLFLLRGKDEAAPRGVAHYAMEAMQAGAELEHCRSAQAASMRMRDWQADNPERVKVGD